MQLPPPPSMLSTRMRAQIIELELVPGTCLGPFILGASLWNTLKFLRREQEAYPSVRVAWAFEREESRSDRTPPPPIIVSAGRHIHLTFDPLHQRLQSIVVQAILTAPHLKPSEATSDEQFDPWQENPNESQTWHRHVVVSYQGRPLFATSPPHTGVPALTRPMVHQTIGPTYHGRDQAPGREGAPGTHIVSYPGLAFAFPLDPDASAGASAPASTVYIFNRASRHPFPIPGKDRPLAVLRAPVVAPGGEPPSCSSSSTTAEGTWVEEALVFPGQGLRLVLSALLPPAHYHHHHHHHHHHLAHHHSSTDDREGIESEVVNLVLGETQVQDVLSDLGTPEARAWKDDQRMSIHSRPRPRPRTGTEARLPAPAAAPASNSGGSESDVFDEMGDDNPARSRLGGQAFFFNYFSLGLDLLFVHSSLAGVVLSKVICHSNTPGHALFGRYKRLPWRLASPTETWSCSDPTPHVDPASIDEKSQVLTPYSTLGSQWEQRVHDALAETGTETGLGDGGSDQGSGGDQGSVHSDTAETMILDRASDSYDFKGRLKLDVGSVLRAVRLPAIVPVPSPKSRVGEKEDKEDTDEAGENSVQRTTNRSEQASGQQDTELQLDHHLEEIAPGSEHDSDHNSHAGAGDRASYTDGDNGDGDDGMAFFPEAEAEEVHAAEVAPRVSVRTGGRAATCPSPAPSSDDGGRGSEANKGVPTAVRTWLDGCVAEINRKDGCISCLTILAP